MTCCGEVINFCVTAGATFHPTIRWADSALTSKPITGMANSTPLNVTAVGHGVPNGWLAAAVDAFGMYEANARRFPPSGTDYHRVTVVDADHVLFDDVSSGKFQPYLSGGALVYQTPVPLDDKSIIFRIWLNPDMTGEPEILLTSSTGLTIDTVNYTIIPELQTDVLTWKTGYYSLDAGDQDSATHILSGILTIE